MKQSKGIKNWPCDDRPREKLFKAGEHTLSTAELLAILVRIGTRGESALDLARRVLDRFKTLRNMSHTQVADWKDCKGLGVAKIAQIKAALELGRRCNEEVIAEKPKVVSSKDIAAFLMPRLRDLKKEVFKIIMLDAQNRMIEVVEATEGTVNEAFPILREIFAKALQAFAVSVICAHNHPSGKCEPSSEDRVFTRELARSGELLGIRVLDHVIIGDNCYFSFKDNGEI